MDRFGAAAIIIGNEVLSAKVEERNGALLVRRLRERGVPLRSMVFVPDDVDQIVEALLVARRRARWVFTSGGVGPTHDDVTVRAVALALGRRVARDPGLEAQIRARSGESLTAEALRLADLPEGGQLLYQEGIWYPVLCCDDVYLLPGVPELFRDQLETVLLRLEGRPVQLAVLYLSVGEPEIAAAVDRVALAMPEVAIGSYPTFDRSAGYRVKLTVEHAERPPVDEAVRRLSADLPPGSILRVE